MRSSITFKYSLVFFDPSCNALARLGNEYNGIGVEGLGGIQTDSFSFNLA